MGQFTSRYKIFLLFFSIFSLSAQVAKISNDVTISKVSDNIFLIKSYAQTKDFGKVDANGLLLVSGEEALLIDTPWDNIQTEDLYNWVLDSLRVTIKDVILTHWHADRMGGLSFLETKGVDSYASSRTVETAKEKGLPIPKYSFIDSISIELHHDIPVKCYFLGEGHTSDNIVVYLPTENLLFGGCLIKDIEATNLGNLEDANVEAWQVTINNVENTLPNARIIVPGHGAIDDHKVLYHTSYLLKNKLYK